MSADRESLFASPSPVRRELREVVESPRDCIVCGHLTHDRTTTFKPDGRVHYRTFRCADFQPCADRRNAKRKRPR